MELHSGNWVKVTTLDKDQKSIDCYTQPKTKEKPRFDLGEIYLTLSIRLVVDS